MKFSHFWLFLLLCINVSLARKRLLKVNVVYSADGSLDGLGCAIHDPYTYNAARFNTVTKTCTPLPRTWYHTQSTPLPDNNYFQLMELEVLELQGVEKLELFPAISLPYGGLVLYVTTIDNPQGPNSYAVKFLDGLTITFADFPKTDGQNTRRCFFSGMNLNRCMTFNMVLHYTDHKLAYRIMGSDIQIYTNNVHNFNFNTGYSMERHRRLKVIQGDPFTCIELRR